MQIEEIKDREIWNKFIAEQDFSQFLQSFQWAEFQKNLKRKIWRLGILDKDKILGAVLIIKHQLPFNKSYLYSPRGPVLAFSQGISNFKFLPIAKRSRILDADRVEHSRQSRNKVGIISKLVEKIKEIAKEERSIFWRIEPLDEGIVKILKDLSYQLSVVCYKFSDVQPSKTLILDLTKSEEELLAEMHPKTRYNIRLAQRHGIQIRNPKSEILNPDFIEDPRWRNHRDKSQILNSKFQNYFEKFWQLLQETSKRDKFRLHPKIYYQKMLEVLDNTKLFLAEQENKIIASNIIISFGDTFTYLHGASDWHFRNLMAPHLLQWQQILEAKRIGFHFYDFWGIDEKKWPGLTRFKKSFGGEPINFPGTFDLVFDRNWYWLYKLGKKLRL